MAVPVLDVDERRHSSHVLIERLDYFIDMDSLALLINGAIR
jgi:hypothetical protein